VLRLGGQGGRAVGLVRFSTDVGLVVGPFAVGALADLFGVAAPFGVLAALTGILAVAIRREGRFGTRAMVSV
jgi:MFS family permease